MAWSCRLAALWACIFIVLWCLIILSLAPAGSTAMGRKDSTNDFFQDESLSPNQRDRSIPPVQRLRRRQQQQQQQQSHGAEANALVIFLVDGYRRTLLQSIVQIIDKTVVLNVDFEFGELHKLNLPCLENAVRLYPDKRLHMLIHR